jgi:hypothetical protein
MVQMARTAGLVTALFLVTAAPAGAFVPDLSVELSPPSVGKSPALTATISQPATDTPIERFTLTIPAGFTAATAPGAAACGSAQLTTNTCDENTQVGDFAGHLSSSVPLDGTINKTGDETFGMYVSILGGAVSQVVRGSLVSRDDGTLDLMFDELPALSITDLVLRFAGGDRSLIHTPARCGDYTLDGKFTSRRGEFAIDRSAIEIGGCANVPIIRAENVRFSDRRFRAGGSPYSGRTIIAWWLPQAVDRTNVLILRRADGRWRKIGRLVGTGNAGDNSLRWDGRLHGDKLEPGRYAVRIKPTGSNAGPRVGFRILRGT